ncbi:MAG: hypothetical protein WC531_00645 [Candidatus Paceibacterota bacterium]
MSEPYIGITDFLTYEQVKRMLRAFKAHRSKKSRRRLHVGVMMSRKTLRGLETKGSQAFPPKETIDSIFSSDEVMNCLHYADYGYDPDLGKNLSEAIGYGGIGINALQLDMVWPDPGQIAHGVHTSRKQLEIILQIGERALDEAGNDPIATVERLQDYEGVIHHVLLDKSMGRGLGMDAVGLIPFAWAIKESFPTLGLGAADGLGPNTVQLVKPLLQAFPDLSMQGKLRPSGNALDPIDWGMAETYLVEALDLTRS